MNKLEAKNYRDKLAKELKTQRNTGRTILDEAQQSGEYIESFYEHNKPRWEKREAKRRRELK